MVHNRLKRPDTARPDTALDATGRRSGAVAGFPRSIESCEKAASGSLVVTDTLATQTKSHSVSSTPCIREPRPEP